MRKSFFRIAVAAVLIVNLLIPTAFAEMAVVSASDVNLRSGPGLNYSVIDCLAKGTAITVTDRSDGTWYAVEYQGNVGYISSNYIKIAEESNNNDFVAGYDSGVINAMYVRFRSGPSSDSSILGDYNRGKTVTITGTSGQWTAVIIDGVSGYVFSQYVSRGSLPAPTATPTPEAAPAATPVPAPTAAPVVDDYGDDIVSFGEDSVSFGEPAATVVTPVVTAAPVSTPTPSETNVNTNTEPEPTEIETPKNDSKTGYIDGNDVRFRTGPSTGYTIISSYNRGKALTITGVSGDWSAVTIDGNAGYVFSQYVKEGVYGAPTEQTPTEQSPESPAEQPEATTPAAEEKLGYIAGNNVRFRSSPSMSGEIITELYFGNEVKITGSYGDWTAVIYDGSTGYVYSQYVVEGSFSIITPEQPEQSDNSDAGNNEPAVNTGSEGEGGGPNLNVSSTGAEIAAFACQYVGYNYCWGGASPETGFDCSGLVYYTYKSFGYKLNRVAQDQANNGRHVEASELQPGDILCFYSGGSYIGHSGIYIGDNKFVHSANSSTGVIISELSGYYASRGFEARRIVD